MSRSTNFYKTCDLCIIIIAGLFFTALKVPVFANKYIGICVLLFEWYLLLKHKKLLVDVKCCFLLSAMALHTLLYNYLVIDFGVAKFIDLIQLPVLYYLLGKQLLYYSFEGKSYIRKMWIMLGAVLAGNFILSGLEFYSFYSSPTYPSRIWSDFWGGQELLYATQYSFFSIAWVALLFCGCWLLKERRWHGIVLLAGIFVINAVNIFNGNRMHLGVLLVVFAFSLGIFCVENRKNQKLLMGIGMLIICTVAIWLTVFIFDIGNIRESSYVQRFLLLAQNERLTTYKGMIQQMPTHLWGGEQMDLHGLSHAHNMWLHIYNSSGIIPFALICLFILLNIFDCVKIITSNSIEVEVKYVIPPVCAGYFLYLMFELGSKTKPDYIMYYTFFAGMAAQFVQRDKEMQKQITG